MNEPHPAPFAAVVIVAAGRGERFGRSPKVLEPAAGQPLLGWSLLAASQAWTVREIVVVTGEHTDSGIRQVLDTMSLSMPTVTVGGGVRRQDSVAAGVAAVSSLSEVVLVHDGARPLVTASMFDACACAARDSGAAIMAIPVSDSLKRVNGLTIGSSVPRDSLWAAQTPQGFRRGVLERAIAQMCVREDEYTDEASMLEAMGIPVVIVPGHRSNIKVTHHEDLELVDALLCQRANRAQEAKT